MKINFLIIISSLFYLILNIEYDLADGESKEIINLSAGSSYKFYIKAEKEQELHSSIRSDSYFDSNQKIYYYEYSSRKSESYLRYKTNYCYNSTSCGYTFEICENSTKYAAFEITLLIPMSNLDIYVYVDDILSKKIKDGITYFFLIILIIIVIIVSVIVVAICQCFIRSNKNNNVYYNNYPNNAAYVQPMNY